MSERPRKATSPVPPVEDPPRDPVDAGEPEERGDKKSSRPGRRVRTRPGSGPKDTAADSAPVEAPITFDAESVTQAWDKFREADEIVKLLVNRANAINAEVEDAWNAGGFDKIAVREEILKFDDVRDNQGRLSLDAVQEASRIFHDAPNKENAQTYTEAVEDFAIKVQLLEASAKNFTAAVERAPQEHVPQEAGTAREERARLRKAVEEMSALERTKAETETAQKQYFEALKERFSKQGGIETLSNQFINTSNSGSKDLKQLREQWIQARAEFAGAQRASVEARLKADPSEARNRLLERLKNKYGEGSEKANLLGRYERIVTAGSVVIGQEEAEQKIKEEGLSERDKGTFDAMLGWYKKQPPGLRVMGTSALMFGVGAVIAGTPAGWAALGLGGSAALLRWAAEVQKGPKTKATFGFLSRIASVGGVAGLLTEAAVRGTHSVLGTTEKAEAKLNAREGLGNLSDPKNLARISKERRKATVVGESIKRQGRLARMVGSLTGGWLFGNAMGGNADDAETIGGTAEAPAVVRGDDIEAQEPPRAVEAVRDVAPPVAPVESVPPAAVVPEAVQSVEPIVATIETGEGFNKLFLDLRDSVDERLHGMQDTSSPVMKYLFETSPTELSDRIGAFDPKTGESMIMQVGDKLYLDDKGDLYFERAGEEAVLVMENDPSAPDGYVVHELKDVEMLRSAAPTLEVAKQPSPSEAEAEPAAPASAVEATEETQSSSLPVNGTEDTDDTEEAGHIRLGDYIGDSNPSAALQDQLPANPPEATNLPERVLLGDYIAAQDDQSEGVDAETGVSTNENGIEVNVEEAGKYQWQVPGTDTTYTVVYGGSPEETRVLIERELELNPTARILVNETYTNPSNGTIETRVNEWYVNQEGSVTVEEGVKNAANGLALPPIAENDLIRKLS